MRGESLLRRPVLTVLTPLGGCPGVAWAIDVSGNWSVFDPSGLAGRFELVPNGTNLIANDSRTPAHTGSIDPQTGVFGPRRLPVCSYRSRGSVLSCH